MDVARSTIYWWEVCVVPGLVIPRSILRSRFRRPWALAVLVLIHLLTEFPVTAAATASLNTPLSEGDYLDDIPVVLSAARLEQPRDEAPAAVTVIDRRMIEASGARDLVDLFRLVPGFQIGFWNGHRQVVSAYGLADTFSRRIQVLIDGRSVYLPSYGGVSWVDLPVTLEEVDRIEVIRGPNAVTYGANAFLGTISIITRHAAHDQGVYLRHRLGSESVRDSVIRYGGSGENTHFRISAMSRKDEGFDALPDTSDTPGVNGRLDYRINNDSNLIAQAGWAGGTRQKGEYTTPTAEPRDQRVSSHYQQLRYLHHIGNEHQFQLQFYHNYHEWKERYVTAPIPALGNQQVLYDYGISSDRYDLELQHSYDTGSSLRAVWGASIRRDRVASDWLFYDEPEHSVNLGRLFLNMEWRTTPLLLQAGGMVEYYGITGTEFLPRVAAHLQFSKAHSIRASYSEATRNPVLIEENSDARVCIYPACTVLIPIWRSRGGLEPEHNATTELAYIASPTKGLHSEIRLFRSRLSNVINYTSWIPPDDVIGGVVDFENADKVRIEGGELSLEYALSVKDRFVLGYSRIRIRANHMEDRYSISAPDESGSAMYMRNFGDGYRGALTYYYIDEMRWLDSDRMETVRRLDVHLSRKLRLPGVDLELAAGLQNVFDPYTEYRTENQFETRYYINMALQFR